ncbi:hypothetical protein KI387_036051, partial [Taxus chinensis]
LPATAIILLCIVTFSNSNHSRAFLDTNDHLQEKSPDILEAEHGVVAADDERCSDIGTDVLREGGHAVDAA